MSIAQPSPRSPRLRMAAVAILGSGSASALRSNRGAARWCARPRRVSAATRRQRPQSVRGLPRARRISRAASREGSSPTRAPCLRSYRARPSTTRSESAIQAGRASASTKIATRSTSASTPPWSSLHDARLSLDRVIPRASGRHRHNRAVGGIDYDAYREQTTSDMEQLLSEAEAQWSLRDDEGAAETLERALALVWGRPDEVSRVSETAARLAGARPSEALSSFARRAAEGAEALEVRPTALGPT